VGRRGRRAVDSSRAATRLALVTRASAEHLCSVPKKLAIEDLYNDPHRLDPFLGTGEPEVLIKEGRAVAQLMSILPSGGGGTLDAARFGKPDFRARFLEMWGADAFQSQLAVSEDFARLRSGRMF
jgi:hypothetical protein